MKEQVTIEYIRTLVLYRGMYRLKLWIEAVDAMKANALTQDVARYMEEHFGGDEGRLCKLLLNEFDFINEVHMTNRSEDGVSVTRSYNEQV